ncbi:phenylacetate-CoA oxygenase subunit PaaI [Halomicroarcula limicola]|uniref:Phenylacetate-CoA oxygenase subunit PaaI n=1 Tax=Haloarcula limicola TaxID=1429915 RepID=A0A8J7YC68_9EURY|nr:Phenylacetic acid catabolic protein [Halomicroarcula limicola]MBV0925966.1 phenylacetate-CoA oxygenase subunit PaaI [Halomicroarcula limicola]
MTENWSDDAVEYVQAIADTKLILSHRYTEWMLSGPVLEDDIAGASAAQDEIGHVRQLFEKLSSHGRALPWLQGDRSPEEFANAACLDEEFDSWVEFVTVADLTERAAWYLIDSIVHEDFDGLGERIGQDEYFHLEHLDGSLERHAEENAEAVEAALEAAVPGVLAFIGPAALDADSDPLVQSGFTDRSAADVRDGFKAQYDSMFEGTDVDISVADWEAPDADEWDSTRRRVGEGHIRSELIDALTGVKNAEFARA